MIDLSFLSEYLVLTIVGICLIVGYVIKTSFPNVENRFIPLIMAVLGVTISIWTFKQINPEVILAGLASGLSSTGLHQAYKNLIKGDEK